jgi:hypothetical protein
MHDARRIPVTSDTGRTAVLMSEREHEFVTVARLAAEAARRTLATGQPERNPYHLDGGDKARRWNACYARCLFDPATPESDGSA